MSRRSDEDERTVVTTLNKSAAVPADKASSEACFVVIYGPEIGRRIALHRGGAFEIGRQPNADLSIDQEAVSRRHARVMWADRHWHIVDLGSTNGTYVNDEAITDRVLRDGDQVKVGRCIFKFLESGSVETSYHEEIYRLMTFDGLTGIHNKRYFHETLEREFSRSRRYQRQLSLLVFDIDFFKTVNDTYGHIAGDAVLKQLACFVRVNLRREDIFARVGGEEFAVILPEIAHAEAASVGQKIREIVEHSEFIFDATRIPVTISLGLASLRLEPPETSQELFARADAKLYQAKQGGRNRLCD